MELALKELLAKPLLTKYVFQQLTEQSFSDLMEKQFYPYFEKEIMVRIAVLNQSYRQALHIADKKESKVLCLSLNEDAMPIAIFKCIAIDADTLLMDISVVHPEYRRQGIYSAVVDALLAYAKKAGFGTVTSTHSPSNNPIIIAKLKKGFYISAMNISPAFGPEIALCYFHNPDIKTAFLLRCGDITVSQAIVDNSRGTFALLAQKLKNLGC